MIRQISILAVQTIYKAEEQRHCRAKLMAFSLERAASQSTQCLTVRRLKAPMASLIAINP
jgi:hypothetical protein